MITDFAAFRWNRAEIHAWNEGDTAALEGVRRSANPHPPGPLFDAWDQGHLGFPLATVDPDADTVVVTMFGRHAVEMLDADTMRTVPSVRAQCGAHSWTTGPSRHAKPESEHIELVAS